MCKSGQTCLCQPYLVTGHTTTPCAKKGDSGHQVCLRIRPSPSPKVGVGLWGYAACSTHRGNELPGCFHRTRVEEHLNQKLVAFGGH